MSFFRGFSQNATVQDIVRERQNDISVIEKLQTGKLQGRIVTGVRDVPADATDVNALDGEGDIIVDSTYIYTLVRVGNDLLWDRRSHSTGW